MNHDSHAPDSPDGSVAILSPARSRADVRADQFADEPREDPFIAHDVTSPPSERWYADEVPNAE